MLSESKLIKRLESQFSTRSAMRNGTTISGVGLFGMRTLTLSSRESMRFTWLDFSKDWTTISGAVLKGYRYTKKYAINDDAGTTLKVIHNPVYDGQLNFEHRTISGAYLETRSLDTWTEEMYDICRSEPYEVEIKDISRCGELLLNRNKT
jgi:hypothetical protein